MSNLEPLAKMNWANLLAYNVQPSDMDLFQQYCFAQAQNRLSGERGPGVIYGCVLSVVAGMQIQISAGLLVMPDGTLLQVPAIVATLANGNGSNPRIDRIEVTYTPTNGTNVVDVNGNSKVLNILYVGSINVVQGTPSATPTIPAATGTNVTVGSVNVPTSATSVNSGNLSQVVDYDFLTSPFSLDSTGLIRFNRSTGILQFSNNNGAQWAASGGGGGGGGGADWQGVDGVAPLEQLEYGQQSMLFSQGGNQIAALWVKAPKGYLPGSPIKLNLGHYSPSGVNNFKFQTTATLIRQGVDPVSSTTNQHASANGTVTNTVVNQYVNVQYDLTDSTGLVNGLSISPEDLLLVQIARVTPTGTDDTGDVRMIPSSTEVSFS